MKGAYVSTGHNCWGILWAPVCGAAMAELVMHECGGGGGAGTSFNAGGLYGEIIQPFSIDRFLPKKPSSGVAGERGRKMGETSVGEQW